MTKSSPRIGILSSALVCAFLSAVLVARPVLAAQDGNRVVLNPETLRTQLLERNLSLAEALNRVHDAKDLVNLARANLLPSLNLGGLLLLASGPSFLLSSVDVLLPFLLPSNWFNYKEQKNLAEAEKLSFYAVRLNTYGSALSLYFTALSDQQILSVLERQASDLESIHELLQEKYDVLGVVSEEDLEHSLAQARLARVRASQMKQLCTQERAAIRSALALPIQAEIELEEAAIPPSAAESLPIEQALSEAQAVSPERRQIDFLIKASQAGRWSRAFAFLNAASLFSQMSSDGGIRESASFSRFNARGSLGIGFAYLPILKLSNRNIEEIRLRQAELRQEQLWVLEPSLKGVGEVVFQREAAGQAEAGLSEVYRAKLEKYELGIGSYTDTLLARTQTTDAAIARIKADLGLSLIRTTLHRTLVTGPFEAISQAADAPTP